MPMRTRSAGLDQQTLGPTGQDKAEWVTEAINTYCRAAGFDPEQQAVGFTVAEVLSSLHHFCQQNGINYGRIVQLASLMYQEERDEGRPLRGQRGQRGAWQGAERERGLREQAGRETRQQ